MTRKYLSTIDAAKVLGISRIAVFNRIRSGSLKALRVGGRYLIEPGEVGLLYRDLTKTDKRKIRLAVQRVLKEYGDVIRKLGSE